MDDAQVISQRMAHIRQNLDQNVDEVVEKAKELVDWRHLVRQYPWAVVGASVAAGYLLVPRKSQRLRPETLAVAQMMEGRPVDAKVRRSSRWNLLAPLGSAVGSLVMRAAVAAAAQYATNLIQSQDPATQGWRSDHPGPHS